MQSAPSKMHAFDEHIAGKEQMLARFPTPLLAAQAQDRGVIANAHEYRRRTGDMAAHALNEPNLPDRRHSRHGLPDHEELFQRQAQSHQERVVQHMDCDRAE